MIKEPMFISPRTFRDYEQYRIDCARASGWNEAMAFIFAEELETERTRTIREKFFVVENAQTERNRRAEEGGIGYVLSKESPEPNGRPKLAECIAVKKDHQAQFIPHDYIIKIYEPNVSYMNDMQKRILMEHELMHIKVAESDSGDLKISTKTHDVEDFKDIIEKYGIDWAEDLHQQMTWDEYEDDEAPALPEGGQLQLPGETE